MIHESQEFWTAAERAQAKSDYIRLAKIRKKRLALKKEELDELQLTPSGAKLADDRNRSGQEAGPKGISSIFMPYWNTEDSLWLFAPNHFIRQACQGLLFNFVFDNALRVAILISSILLALEHPRNDPDSSLSEFLKIGDTIFVGLFGLEAFLAATNSPNPNPNSFV